ncbi:MULTISPECIES: helix-turn-helix domain-containing protein [unclassified Lentimicrobium]|uniref:helix-turn-helix domain-containing protein n=1 Tax=unclassified Lentimicrobium TaxID=2677434 RepID=UPI001554901E|nr:MULTISPECIES: helix-turn-helix domain-containing protein [unclassified Lentimicrobium]NPD46461.1 AAA family ATPase [Lentimicrobium sp. S6]NPD86606.1 AAA family ATPase [Lentimicrobium sp. L6]
MKVNPELDLAWQFVENTNRNIYLTGKAGTGKTTFLHQIKAKTNKRMVVVAPTGVAAINAKGVTIHSFFQMPFGPILPNQLYAGPGNKNTKNTGVQKFNKKKIDIIRSLDLLIIDEVSMVRADLLDGIDQVLRRFKNGSEVFGGVQVLMIGDLQQLAPVVKNDEWSLLKDYYDNAFFFSSRAFQEANAISIELKHIYRQENQDFISILNQIRNNNIDEQSLKRLNQQYNPNFVPKNEEGYITLTTHNRRAKHMNDAELKQLSKTSRFYDAEIEGDFPEYAFPNDEELELKVGAQVMFIKNDSSPDKQFFNGKIGTITYMDKDGLNVQCPGDAEEITVERESWHNIKYSIDSKNEIKEDIIGVFTQIPLRLAWSITIHKSQGLTFEKAIIDAEASFAHGQTYVALSRCKTLEGIVLKSPINQQGIIQDNRVIHFSQEVESQQPDHQKLNDSKKEYQLYLLEQLFSFKQIQYFLNKCQKAHYNSGGSLLGNLDGPLKKMREEGTQELIKIGGGFSNQLRTMSEGVTEVEQVNEIQERIKKAVAYFLTHIDIHISSPLSELSYSSDNKAILKDFKKDLKELEDLVEQKIFCLKGCINGFETQNYLKLRADSIFQKKVVSRVKESRPADDLSAHPDLFKTLKKYRNTMATDEDIEHFQVFTQKSLFGMCESLPTTLNELKKVHGIGKAKINKYGDDLVDIIREYCIQIGKEFSTEEKLELVEKPKKKSKKPTKEISLEMFQSGMTVNEIAKERGLVTTTIEGHLIQYLPTGEITVEDLVDEKIINEIIRTINDMEFKSLTELRKALNDQYSYSQLRLALMKKGMEEPL